jgi:hypothetical protein
VQQLEEHLKFGVANIVNKLVELSSSSCMCVRDTGLQKTYFDTLPLLLDFASQYLLQPIEGLRVGIQIYHHHADFGVTSAERWYIYHEH